MHSRISKFHWFLSQQVGLDAARLLRFFRALPWYYRDLSKFKQKYKGRLALLPCLHDRREQSGAASSEYFVQDLRVAQKIFRAQPQRHLDIGSRLDGFVAHLASFREVTVADIRPNHAQIANIRFVQANLMCPAPEMIEGFDSVSCLHTLEHFGLGRYGDPIDALGYVHGLGNIARLVGHGGTLHLSVPIGIERVEFNAHRIFDPFDIIKVASECGLDLRGLDIVTAKGELQAWDGGTEWLEELSRTPYSLGIFDFRKKMAAAPVQF